MDRCESNGYHPESPDHDTFERLASPMPVEPSVEGIIDEDEIGLARQVRVLLAAAKTSMERSGFYAYLTFDQQNRPTVASDDEAGRFDIRIEGGDFLVSLETSSPGVYMDEENQWKRRAMERLARITIPKISRGMLDAHQEAFWDDVEQGVAVRLIYRVPVDHADEIGEFVRTHLPELDELLAYVERQLG